MSLGYEGDSLYDTHDGERSERRELPLDSSLESMVLNLKDAYESQSQDISALDITLSQNKEEISLWEERLLFKNQEKKNVERELIWFVNDIQQIEKHILETSKKVDKAIELKQDECYNLKRLQNDYQSDKQLVTRYDQKIEKFEEKLRQYKEKTVTSAKVNKMLDILKAEEAKRDLLKEEITALSEEDSRLAERRDGLASEVLHLQQEFEKEKLQRSEQVKKGQELAEANAAKVEQLKRKLNQMQSYHGALKKQLRGLANRMSYKAER